MRARESVPITDRSEMESSETSVEKAVQRLRSQPPLDCHTYEGGLEVTDSTHKQEVKPSLPHRPRAAFLNGKPTPRHSTNPLAQRRKPVLERSSTVLHGLGLSRRLPKQLSSSQEDLCSPCGQSLPAFDLQAQMQSSPRSRREREAEDGGPRHDAYNGSGPSNSVYGSSQAVSVSPNVAVPESYGPECSLCMEEFEDEGLRVPRNLQCGHTYCTGCLQKLLSRSKSGIDCPRCNVATSIPGLSIERLPKNFGLLEILSSSASGSAKSSPLLQRKKSRPSVTSRPPLFCEEHGDHLSSYCVNDGVLVCSSCLLFGSHKHHNCLLVNMAAKESREKLAGLAPEVLTQQKKMESLLTQIEEVTGSVQESGGKLIDRMDSHFDSLIQQIEERRRMLKVEAMERTQLRVQALLEQASDLRESMEKAKVTYHSATNLLRSDDYALLAGAALTLRQIEAVFINPPSTAPLANDDLTCDFSRDLREEIVSQVVGYGTVKSDVGMVKDIYLQPYHDGIRISWDPHNYADNQGISYHLQVSSGASEYVNIYRGGNTKFTWKTELEGGMMYNFRVQVRTTEGVGKWTDAVGTYKGTPAFHWHDSWRNVKIDLTSDRLEAAWSKGGVQNYWATFAGDRFMEGGQHFVEIEIVDLGRPKPNKKLAIGVVECSNLTVKSVPWYDGKYSLGQWKEVPSWSYHPMSGIINSRSLPPIGKNYNVVQLQDGDRIGMLVDMDQHKLSFFCNGRDLGVAFDGLNALSLLPAVSICDKIRIRLRFPPPPYSRRSANLVHLSSGNHLV